MNHLIAIGLALAAPCEADASGAQSTVSTGSAVGNQPSDPGLAAITDPPRHPTRPARNRQLVIPSGPSLPQLGRPAEMNALFFLASGEGPKPTMLLLHGLPGNERNLDLAQAVRRAGWNVLTFTYRGAWGSEGSFSIPNAIADAQSALAFLRSAEAVRAYDIDPTRIVVAGHSMGGYAAAAAAAGDRGVAGLVLLDAWDIGATAVQIRSAGDRGRAAFVAELDDLGHALGPISGGDIADDLIRHGEAWRLAPLAPALAGRPVLTIYASEGGAAENRAFAEVLRGTEARVTPVEMQTDHGFADHRIALAAEVVRWLQRLSR